MLRRGGLATTLRRLSCPPPALVFGAAPPCPHAALSLLFAVRWEAPLRWSHCRGYSVLSHASALPSASAPAPASSPHPPLAGPAAEGCTAALRAFLTSAAVAAAADAARLPRTLLPAAAASLQLSLLSSCNPGLAAVLSTCAPPPQGAANAHQQQLHARRLVAAEGVLLPLLIAHAKAVFGPRAGDLSPLNAFPAARSAQRRLIYHHGPTNSGKTHAALEALKAARSGVYCGPLRLLALEAFDALNAAGVPCNLKTGQEAKEVAGARHTSCTVEMCEAPTTDAAATAAGVVDVAVIDEIQLLADDSRGWAWTRALYGIAAKEVHVCGDGSALGLVRAAASELGEPLVEIAYERRSPLTPLPTPLGSVAACRPGDALVAFSRAAIFSLKRDVERATGLRAAVVYGALPPEARRRQAALFNAPESFPPGVGCHVLVASDAIGLGLNLQVKRVVFASLQRRDGASPQDPPSLLPPSLVRQIAGRAGRAGGRFPAGEACVLHATDVPYFLTCMASPAPPAMAAGVLPTWEDHIAPFCAAFPSEPLHSVLARVSASADPGGRFFLCRNGDVAAASQLLERVAGLSAQQRFVFATAPVSSARAPDAAAALLSYAAAYAAGGDVPLGVQPLPPSLLLPLSPQRPSSRGASSANAQLRRLAPGVSPTPELLRELEARHAAASLYLWLAQRLEAAAFPDVAVATDVATELCDALSAALAAGSDTALRAYRRSGGRGEAGQHRRARGGGGGGGWEGDGAASAGGGAARPRRAEGAHTRRGRRARA